MYIRFESKKINKHSNSPEGVFYSIWSLIDKDEMSSHELKVVSQCFDWLGMHFKAPACLSNPENSRAICWLKESAVEPMKRIWPIVQILEEHGVHIEKVTSNDPGIIVFENGWQVAAKPYKKGKEYSSGVTRSKYQAKLDRE
jgi:hypothetical protein